MRIARNWSRFAVLLGLMALIAAGCGKGSNPTTQTKTSGPLIVVASANFSESVTLAEIYAQALTAKGYNVGKKLNAGTREVYFPSMENGKLGFVPDYLNTLIEFLKGKGSSSVATDEATIGPLLAPKGLVALKAAPAQDRNEFAVTKATADKYHLTKVSDLAAIGDKLTLGGPPECPKRPLCQQGLEQTYGIHFKAFKPLDTGGPLTVSALKSGAIDVGLLFTTDPAFLVNGFVRLDDDKGLQGADNVLPVVRNTLVLAYGAEFTNLINSISAKLTTEEVIKLNKAVSVDKEDSADAATQWLKDNGFIG